MGKGVRNGQKKWENIFFLESNDDGLSLELSGMFQLLQMDFWDTPMTYEKQNKTLTKKSVVTQSENHVKEAVYLILVAFWVDALFFLGCIKIKEIEIQIFIGLQGTFAVFSQVSGKFWKET